MSTEIYLIRHGESLGNKESRFLGHTDWDLSETGYLQAQCVARYFKDIKLDAIYSSDLIRAVHTIEPTALEKGLEIIKVKELREIAGGDWEARKFDDIQKEYPKQWRNWLSSDTPEMQTVNGETVEHLLERVYAAVLKIARENEGRTVAVSLHTTTIRALVNKLMGNDIAHLFKTRWVANASVSKLVYENSTLSVNFSDSCEHLGELVTRFKGR